MKLLACTVAASLALALTGCTDHEAAGGPLPTPTAAPPSLSDAPLRQIATHGTTRADGDSPIDAYGVLETEDLVVVLTQPDNSLAAYARDTAEEVWRVRLPRDETTDAGACFGPRRAAPDLLAVFVGTGCSMLVTYDLATGEQRHQASVIEEYIMADGSKQTEPSSTGYPVEADVQGGVELDGRLWFLTRGFLGYVDDDGRPVRVAESAELGLGGPLADSVYGIALGVRPEDHQLVAGLLHSRAEALVSDHRWLGITVSDPAADPATDSDDAEQPTVEVAWSLDETDGSGLGIADLRPRKAPILMRTEDPGTPLAVGLTGNRVGLARVDAATGKVPAVAVVPRRRGTSVTDSGSVNVPEIAWSDGVLYTSSGTRDASAFRRWGIDAYDLATGEERWHTELPSPPGLAEGSVFYLRSLQLAADGALYAVTSDAYEEATLHRVDPATGELTGTWPLPNALSDKDYTFTIAGDIVIALTNSPYHKLPSMVMLSNNDALLPTATGSPSGPTGATSVP